MSRFIRSDLNPWAAEGVNAFGGTLVAGVQDGRPGFYVSTPPPPPAPLGKPAVVSGGFQAGVFHEQLVHANPVPAPVEPPAPPPAAPPTVPPIKPTPAPPPVRLEPVQELSSTPVRYEVPPAPAEVDELTLQNPDVETYELPETFRRTGTDQVAYPGAAGIAVELGTRLGETVGEALRPYVSTPVELPTYPRQVAQPVVRPVEARTGTISAPTVYPSASCLPLAVQARLALGWPAV